jgi:hypothetical protein
MHSLVKEFSTLWTAKNNKNTKKNKKVAERIISLLKTEYKNCDMM